MTFFSFSPILCQRDKIAGKVKFKKKKKPRNKNNDKSQTLTIFVSRIVEDAHQIHAFFCSQKNKFDYFMLSHFGPFLWLCSLTILFLGYFVCSLNGLGFSWTTKCNKLSKWHYTAECRVNAREQRMNSSFYFISWIWGASIERSETQKNNGKSFNKCSDDLKWFDFQHPTTNKQ